MLGWGEEARLHPSLVSLCLSVAVGTDAPPERPALPRVGGRKRAAGQMSASGTCVRACVRAHVTAAAGSLRRVTSQSCSHLPCAEAELLPRLEPVWPNGRITAGPNSPDAFTPEGQSVLEASAAGSKHHGGGGGGGPAGPPLLRWILDKTRHLGINLLNNMIRMDN